MSFFVGGMGLMKKASVFWWVMLLIGVEAKIIQVPGDAASIQEGIDVAGSGDLVLVAPGTYRERITLKKGVVLRSYGEEAKAGHDGKRAEKTIIDGSKVEGKTPGVTMAAGATLDGFTVTGVGKYDEGIWQKSWDEQGANQAYEHIGEFGVPGIAIERVDCTVVNNIVHHNGGTGIAIRGAKCSPMVRKNTCYRNMGGGIGSMDRSTAIIDTNTCYENFFAGIGHSNASPVVRGNICYRNIRAGIGISEGASPVVRNNRCYENRRAGIGIRTGKETRPVVEDNECFSNAMAGIGAEDEAAPIIRGNQCSKNTLAGIGCRDGASAVIEGNTCRKNKAAGIGINSATAHILRNQSSENETAGIGISGKSTVTLVGNTCLANKLVALGIPGEAKVTMSGNFLSRESGMPPIVMVGAEAKVTMTGNTIHGGGIAGVMLSGKLTATNNRMKGKNGGSGIWVREGAELVRSGNEIEGYKVSVRGEAETKE